MNLVSLLSHSEPFSSERARQLALEQRAQQYRRTDQMFARLLAFEFVAGIATALWISPFAWSGHESQLHPHVWSAMVLGALIVSLPIWLARAHPDKSLTRQVIGIAQLLMSGLLIHLTQGRIETHFHVFGSLAFLAFYRDWRVLITATTVTSVDHLVRGYVWPPPPPDKLCKRRTSHSTRFDSFYLTTTCLAKMDSTLWSVCVVICSVNIAR